MRRFEKLTFRHLVTKWLIAVVFIGCINPGFASIQYEYLYWDWGQTEARDDYQFALLRAALEKTTPEFGEYRLERVMRKYAARRGNIEINLGRNINIRVSPWLIGGEGNPELNEANMPVCFPIMSNLMGYRRLLIPKRDLGKFNAIKTESELKRLVLGQGQYWVDLKIYAHNNYIYDDNAQIMESLVPMLMKGRFDYIPLGIIEIDGVIAESKDYIQDIMEAPNITIHYPFPSVFFVGKNRPDLAQRLQIGLFMMKEDGSFEQLLKSHFKKEFEKLQSDSNRIFNLKNPYSPDMDTCQKPRY